MEDAEKTNFTLNGTDWFELKGTYESSEDKDYFEVKVDPKLFETDTAYSVELVAITEKGPLDKFMSAGFPATAYSYNAEGKVMNHLAIALSGGIKVKAGTERIVFMTNGKAGKGGGASMYTGGNPYSIKIK